LRRAVRIVGREFWECLVPRREPLNVWTPVVSPIEALADEAADWITDQIYARYAQVLTPFGARGRFQTRQDLRYHVEFLSAAVEVHAPGYFTDYVVWLAGVLRARGVPVQTLAESLHLLRRFLESRLEEALLVQAQSCLDAALAALANGWEAAAPRYQARMPDPHTAVGALTRCLLEGDSAAARAIVVDSATEPDRPGYVKIATHLFQPALYAIGQKWERNEITVAQEHLATAMAQTLLVELFLKGPFQPSHGSKVLLAGIEHNHHVMGLRMLADAYELAGWSVQYLGANTPTQALLAQVDKTSPDLLGLSVSLVQQLPALRHCVSALKSEFAGRCPVILVGGIPTNQFEGVWRHLGADTWAPNAEAAVALST
jgi:MerR family transcriptional regulator, light-induced transcriptional regulator